MSANVPKSLSNSTDENDELKEEKGKKLWAKLKNVYRSIQSMKKPQISTITHPSELGNSFMTHSIVLNSPKKGTPKWNEMAILNAKKDTTLALKRTKERNYFFELVQRGRDSDLMRIREYLAADPNKYLISSHDNESTVNAVNFKNLTPLYVACQNGNHKVVQLLIENGANPLKLVNINNNQDSTLEVAVRWNHFKVVQILLSNIFWPEQILDDAMKVCRNQQIKELLMPFLKRKSCYKRFLSLCYCF